MKGNTIIKVVIVVIAISVVGYIIYHSNRAAEITGLVKNSPEEFNLNHYVDSIADEIKHSSSASSAYKTYNSLYEEINVYAGISKADGATFITPSDLQIAYEHAFNAYWPFINRKADEMFQSADWPDRMKIKEEVNSLLGKEGLHRIQKDSLKNYKDYITGYGRFESLLKQLENCKNAETYNKLSQLSNYSKYPYCNLSKFQSRRNNAEDNAKNAWKSYLKSQKADIQSMGNRLLNDSYISRDDILSFASSKNKWNNDVTSYEKNTSDDGTFTSDKDSLENIYIKLTDIINNQNNY